MMMTHTLRTTLRRPVPADIENMIVFESEPLVMKFTPAKVPQTREQTQKRLHQHIEKQLSLEPFGIWLAFSKSDLSVVGWFMLLPVQAGELELGFMIAQKYWKLGYATEIGQSLIQFADNYAEIKKLIAKTNPNNTASIQTLSKLGFKFKDVRSVPEAGTDVPIQLNFYELVL